MVLKHLVVATLLHYGHGLRLGPQFHKSSQDDSTKDLDHRSLLSVKCDSCGNLPSLGLSEFVSFQFTEALEAIEECPDERCVHTENTKGQDMVFNFASDGDVDASQQGIMLEIVQQVADARKKQGWDNEDKDPPLPNYMMPDSIPSSIPPPHPDTPEADTRSKIIVPVEETVPESDPGQEDTQSTSPEPPAPPTGEDDPEEEPQEPEEDEEPQEPEEEEPQEPEEELLPIVIQPLEPPPGTVPDPLAPPVEGLPCPKCEAFEDSGVESRFLEKCMDHLRVFATCVEFACMKQQRQKLTKLNRRFENDGTIDETQSDLLTEVIQDTEEFWKFRRDFLATLNITDANAPPIGGLKCPTCTAFKESGITKKTYNKCKAQLVILTKCRDLQCVKTSRTKCLKLNKRFKNKKLLNPAQSILFTKIIKELQDAWTARQYVNGKLSAFDSLRASTKPGGTRKKNGGGILDNDANDKSSP